MLRASLSESLVLSNVDLTSRGQAHSSLLRTYKQNEVWSRGEGSNKEPPPVKPREACVMGYETGGHLCIDVFKPCIRELLWHIRIWQEEEWLKDGCRSIVILLPKKGNPRASAISQPLPH